MSSSGTTCARGNIACPCTLSCELRASLAPFLIDDFWHAMIMLKHKFWILSAGLWTKGSTQTSLEDRQQPKRPAVFDHGVGCRAPLRFSLLLTARANLSGREVALCFMVSRFHIRYIAFIPHLAQNLRLSQEPRSHYFCMVCRPGTGHMFTGTRKSLWSNFSKHVEISMYRSNQ